MGRREAPEELEAFLGSETQRFKTRAELDVGPITRQSLTRATSFFDSRAGLTLFNELTRSQGPE